MDLKKELLLYRNYLLWLCFSLFLGACSITVPHQELSDAKQALARAKSLTRNSPTDKNDYLLAKGLLVDAEEAIDLGENRLASSLISTSKKHSQAIFMRHNKPLQ